MRRRFNWAIALTLVGVTGCPPPSSRVVSGERGGTIVSARAQLATGDAEAPGYALYSYVLCTRPPKKTTCETLLSSLKTYAANAGGLAIPTNHVNITYVPVTVSVAGAEVESSTFVDNYSVPRALQLVSLLGLKPAGGPYIVSLDHPIKDAIPVPAAVQDLSAVPDGMIDSWAAYFVDAASKNDWSNTSIEALALRFRTVATQAAIGFMEATDGAKRVFAKKAEP